MNEIEKAKRGRYNIQMLNFQKPKFQIWFVDGKFRPDLVMNYFQETPRHEEIVGPPHRLSGGGIADNLLKDPSDIERMDRVKR